MGLEKVLKKLPWPLHSSNAFPLRRKVGFAFGLGLVVSLLILTEIIVKNPFNTSSFNPVYGGLNGFTINSFSSSFSNTSVSSSLELQNSTDFLQRNVDEGVKKTLHENESSLSKSEALMENTHDVTDSETVTEKPKLVNVRRKKRVSKKTRIEHLPGKGKIEGFYNDSGPLKRLFDSSGKCDIFDGKWVRDARKPLYPPGSCPYIATSANCYLHGRPDNDFVRWKWKPKGCDIPSLNASDFLERLRGKRMVFVGDSLNRNMWASLVCILRNSIKEKKRVYSISGKKKFNRRGFSALRFEDYNCSIDLAFSPFLVRKSYFNGSKIMTLRLDLMDWMSPMYSEADVLVFNSGHWWTDSKTSKGENFYRMGDYVYPKLQVLKAYRKGLATWAKWVDKNINSNRTLVFFRGMSLTHYRGGQWNSGGRCHKETKPIFNENYLEEYPPKMKIVERVLQKMKTPVLYLNISRLTGYRKDGHPSIYRMDYNSRKERIASVKIQDCGHWCLPGVPDTWNELFYASLLMSGKLEKDHDEIDQIFTQNHDNVM